MRKLTLVAVVIAMSPATRAVGQVPEGPPDPIRGTTRIAVTPTLVQRGTDVTVTWLEGAEFDDESVVHLMFSKPGYPTGPIAITTHLVTSKSLAFEIPKGIACGTWYVRTSTRREPPTVSNSVTLEVSKPCADPLVLSQLTPSRGAPGATITATGSEFGLGLVIELRRVDPDPPLRATIEASALLGPNRMTFALPTSERACGSVQLRLRSPNVMVPSNEKSFYFACDPRNLSVLSFNVRMMIDSGFASEGADWRAAIEYRDRMSGAIPAHPVIDGHDVIVFQEMFSDSHRNRILSQLSSRYPSRSRRLGEDRGAKQDGGVVILSRWPIANCPAVQKIFDVCDGTDCGAEKGVLYVRIVKEGQPYNIFGTHLNAGSGANATNVRLQQLRAIKRFIDEQRLAKTEPVIIAGDFNIDKSSGEYASLLSGLNVTHPPLQPGGYSPATEPRGQYFEARDCPRPGQHYLDYILVSKDHKRLAYASNEALMPCTADGGNLSDHYPVLGRFTTELVVTPIPPE